MCAVGFIYPEDIYIKAFPAIKQSVDTGNNLAAIPGDVTQMDKILFLRKWNFRAVKRDNTTFYVITLFGITFCKGQRTHMGKLPALILLILLQCITGNVLDHLHFGG